MALRLCYLKAPDLLLDFFLVNAGDTGPFHLPTAMGKRSPLGGVVSEVSDGSRAMLEALCEAAVEKAIAARAFLSAFLLAKSSFVAGCM